MVYCLSFFDIKKSSDFRFLETEDSGLVSFSEKTTTGYAGENKRVKQ